MLGVGVVVGIAGNWLIAPAVMSAFGVAFIGNIWALSMFGIGLLVRGYSTLLFNNRLFASLIPGGDIAKAYVPHGMMVGAGIVALDPGCNDRPARGTNGGGRRRRHAHAGRGPAFDRPWQRGLPADRSGDRHRWAVSRHSFCRHAGAVPGLRRIRRTGARTDRRPGRNAFRLVPCLCGGADHAGDRHAHRLPAGCTGAAGRLFRRDRTGVRRHGLRPEGRLHAARLRQRPRVRARRPPSAVVSLPCSHS